MGGILSGIFTPTESSAIAVIYTALIGTFVYRSLGWKGFFEAAQKSVRTASMVLFMIAAATAFGFALALLEVPTALAALIGMMTDNPIMTIADHQRDAAGAGHLHGHGAADRDHDADLPAGGDGERG